MPSERVLICGGGVAGSVLAFWLAKSDFQVVLIERSKADQKLGQGIEIEEPALKVVKAMGILDKLNAERTGELGFTLLDQQSRSYGTLEVGGISPTGALELMRGDLTRILYQSADESPNVTYHYETSIRSLRQTPEKVIVDLENRTKKSDTVEEFDYVVGADGINSSTRNLIMGPPEKLNYLKPVGAFCAYFSITKQDQDWPNSRLCHFAEGRILWMRPIGKESTMTSVCFIYLHADVPSLRKANALGDRMKQKEAFAELFSGLGWETGRVIEQMMKAENFYSDELVQVKLPKWSQDRVVLLGDAAWAPSPFTGQGNQLAIIGAWVLAQEMSRNPSTLAFKKYEDRLRSYVQDCQKIPLGGYGPYLLNPQSVWGVWLLRRFFLIATWLTHLISWTKMGRFLPDREQIRQDDFDLEI